MSAVAPISQRLLFDVPLARLNTWRVGGHAATFFRPASLTEITEYFRSLDLSVPVFCLGFGSNVLVRDGGFRGTVVSLREALGQMQLDKDGLLVAEAGAPCAKVARFCAAAGFAGLECFAGIPGTVGGALAMNAGAFGQETWDRVIAVETLARDGSLRQRAADEFTIAYRSVQGLQDELFVRARFQLDPANSADISAKIANLVATRNRSQPLGVASCGSVFRNPPGGYAAKLIESAGLKGHARGKARVSEQHANFIINEGGARAADIELLINDVRDGVQARFGVVLQPEVRMVGEP